MRSKKSGGNIMIEDKLALFFNPKTINAKHIGQQDEIKKLKQYDIL